MSGIQSTLCFGASLTLRDGFGWPSLRDFVLCLAAAGRQRAGNSLLRFNARVAHLTSSRAMVIKPILAEEISENPCCSSNREGLGVFAPIRMTVEIRKKQRYPHE